MTERPGSDPDDLGPWADDDLVRALRAPGTSTELADQERYVAAFRTAGESNVRSLPRRVVGRLGAGGTAVVVTVALTSGVAAAYTGHLPAPVQQFMHTVIGAPNAPGRGHPEASPPSQSPGTPTSSAPSATPSSSGPSTVVTPTPSATPTGGGPSGLPGTGPSQSPGSPPTTAPTTGTTTPASGSGAAAAAMSMSAVTHFVALDQTTTLSGVVTDATGTAVPDASVVLQVRGPRNWRPVAQVTTDDTGLASATTPAITRSARFRWHAARGVHSPGWLVRMVPTLTVTAQVGGSTTTLMPSAQGSRAGDRFRVFRHVPGRTTAVRRARLDATGSAVVSVLTPRRRAAFVVVLLPTKRHTGARAKVAVVPPAPASVSISGSATRVASGTSIVVDGTVTSATGDVLPRHRVVLMRRGPARWRPVGHAVSDAEGHVTISTPAITATSRFRLRTDHGAHSSVWRVVEQPAITVSGQRDGTTTDIGVSTSGARPGDKVVLFRRVNGRLVRMRHSRLDAGGTATFAVKARQLPTTYVVRLVVTQRHGPAAAAVAVAGA